MLIKRSWTSACIKGGEPSISYTISITQALRCVERLLLSYRFREETSCFYYKKTPDDHIKSRVQRENCITAYRIGIAQSARLALAEWFGNQNHAGAKDSPHPSRLTLGLSLLYNRDRGTFPGIKQPRRGVVTPTLSRQMFELGKSTHLLPSLPAQYVRRRT